MEIIPKDIEQYIADHTSPQSALLHKIERETYLQENMARMVSGHIQGRLLSMISKLIKPKRILEIGTFTGYSAICLAEGLQQDGELHTIDFNEELQPKLKNYFIEAGLHDKIKLHIGDAASILPTLNLAFDLIFIDADKKNYQTYYNLLIDTIRPGAVILADNVLWSGKVLAPEGSKIDKDTQAIMDFNANIQQDQRVENVMVSVRDGLMMIRKK